MTVARTLAIQSVLFDNSSEDVRRSAEALANSAEQAVEAGLLGEWTFVVGDSSARPILGGPDLVDIEEIVRNAGGTAQYLHFGANLGHGGGHDRLAPLAGTELILFLNPDALLAPTSISRLLASLADGIGAVDGRQLPLEHPKDYDSQTGDVSWASGACLMTRREAYEQVGGFDHDTFFLYCDDVDYSWRLKLAGWRVIHQPSARVFHDKRLTVSADIVASTAEIYYSAEAALLLAHKWSRPEIVASILATFDQLGDDPTTRASTEFRRRQVGGDLPDPVDEGRSVGQFVNGNYAPHRY